MSRKQANIMAAAVVAILAVAYYIWQQRKTDSETAQPIAAVQFDAVNLPDAEKTDNPQGADIMSNSLALVNSAPQENRTIAYELDPPEGMEWFYKRFGYSTWFEESAFNVKSFTSPEYESLITAAKGGNESATLALKLSLLRHFQNNPEDTKYNSFKERILSREFLISLPMFVYVADALPDELMDDKTFAMEILQKSPYNLKFLSERLRADRELVEKAAMTEAYVFELASDELRSDKVFVRELLSKNVYILGYISDALKADKELVFPVIKAHPEMFQAAAESLQNDPEVLPIIKSHILDSKQRYFSTLPEKLRADREVIIKVVQSNCRLFELVPKELYDDEEIQRAAKAAIDNSPYCRRYVSSELIEGLAQPKAE